MCVCVCVRACVRVCVRVCVCVCVCVCVPTSSLIVRVNSHVILESYLLSVIAFLNQPIHIFLVCRMRSVVIHKDRDGQMNADTPEYMML